MFYQYLKIPVASKKYRVLGSTYGVLGRALYTTLESKWISQASVTGIISFNYVCPGVNLRVSPLRALHVPAAHACPCPVLPGLFQILLQSELQLQPPSRHWALVADPTLAQPAGEPAGVLQLGNQSPSYPSLWPCGTLPFTECVREHFLLGPHRNSTQWIVLPLCGEYQHRSKDSDLEIWQQPGSSFTSASTTSHVSESFIDEEFSRLWCMISKDMILNWTLSGEIRVILGLLISLHP